MIGSIRSACRSLHLKIDICGWIQKNEELQGAIEDLEALKELNDELEENHIETEKQYQAEIGMQGDCCIFFSWLKKFWAKSKKT